MNPADTTLILAGGSCLAATALLLYRLGRNGRSESLWTRTEARATAVALTLVMLVTLSIGLLVRGAMG